ncbi:MAG: hypothetical protein ABH804_01865 [archaeon]
MRPLRNFDEFVNEGIIRKQSPDKSRATSLIEESKNSYKVLTKIIKEIKVDDSNANYIIKNSYDIIMELIRAKMILDGFKSSGEGAHEAEISCLRKLSFSEAEVQFANQLRYFRNGIVYYGKSFDEDYARKVLQFLDKIYRKLATK